MRWIRRCLLAALIATTGLMGSRADEPLSEKHVELLKTFASEFVEITPGKGQFPKSFKMGSDNGEASEKPVRDVTIKQDFAMAKYEVPQNLYQAVMGNNPSKWKGPRNSVEMFDYAEAVDFCKRITQQLKQAKLLADDEVIRLPSEAEWEYCCRAGSTTRYSFGDEAQSEGDIAPKATKLNVYGWHTGNAAGNDPPVGALKPNAWGLYDMHGYLWEFVSDDWHETYLGAPSDGTAWHREGREPASRVIRSGSWRERFEQLTSSARRAVPANFKRDDLGLRCVRAKNTPK